MKMSSSSLEETYFAPTWRISSPSTEPPFAELCHAGHFQFPPPSILVDADRTRHACDIRSADRRISTAADSDRRGVIEEIVAIDRREATAIFGRPLPPSCAVLSDIT